MLVKYGTKWEHRVDRREKRRGPKTEPCATPEERGAKEDTQGSI